MAEWWLVNQAAQEEIASRIDAAAARVVDRFRAHGNENSLTAAFGQEFMNCSGSARGVRIDCSYRNFLEQAEEPATGADGGMVLTITTPEGTVKKGVLFQAKRLPQDRPVRSLTLPMSEAKRLRGQLEGMVNITTESIILAHTQDGLYAVDALTSEALTLNDLRRFPESCRLVSIGTYLGKWVARCARGDLDPSLVQRILQPNGFLKHAFLLAVETTETPRLMEGSRPIDISSFRGKVPAPRWRRSK